MLFDLFKAVVYIDDGLKFDFLSLSFDGGGLILSRFFKNRIY